MTYSLNTVCMLTQQVTVGCLHNGPFRNSAPMADPKISPGIWRQPLQHGAAQPPLRPGPGSRRSARARHAHRRGSHCITGHEMHAAVRSC